MRLRGAAIGHKGVGCQHTGPDGGMASGPQALIGVGKTPAGLWKHRAEWAAQKTMTHQPTRSSLETDLHAKFLNGWRIDAHLLALYKPSFLFTRNALLRDRDRGRASPAPL